MKIEDIIPGCTYRHKAAWSAINRTDPPTEFDFVFQPHNFYDIYEGTMTASDIEPIEICDEMFDRLGFSKDIEEFAENVFFHSKAPMLQFAKTGLSGPTYVIGRWLGSQRRFVDIIGIKYVHELQAAYYLLGLKLYLGTEKKLHNGGESEA